MELSLTLLFLWKTGCKELAKGYAESLLNVQLINFTKFRNFPFPSDDFYEAILNREKKFVKFKSTLVLENLYEWLILLDDKEFFQKANVELFNKAFADVSFQMWFYDSDDELKFFQGNLQMGTCFIMPKLKSYSQYKTVLKKILKEIDYKNFFAEKKGIPYISLIASLLYRQPINPYLYLKSLK